MKMVIKILVVVVLKAKHRYGNLRLYGGICTNGGMGMGTLCLRAQENQLELYFSSYVLNIDTFLSQ